MQETKVWSLGREDLLEKEMETHSSRLAWEVPWTRRLVGCCPWGLKSLIWFSYKATKQQPPPLHSHAHCIDPPLLAIMYQVLFMRVWWLANTSLLSKRINSVGRIIPALQIKEPRHIMWERDYTSLSPILHPSVTLSCDFVLPPTKGTGVSWNLLILDLAAKLALASRIWQKWWWAGANISTWKPLVFLLVLLPLPWRHAQVLVERVSDSGVE